MDMNYSEEIRQMHNEIAEIKDLLNKLMIAVAGGVKPDEIGLIPTMSNLKKRVEVLEKKEEERQRQINRLFWQGATMAMVGGLIAFVIVFYSFKFLPLVK